MESVESLRKRIGTALDNNNSDTKSKPLVKDEIEATDGGETTNPISSESTKLKRKIPLKSIGIISIVLLLSVFMFCNHHNKLKDKPPPDLKPPENNINFDADVNNYNNLAQNDSFEESESNDDPLFQEFENK